MSATRRATPRQDDPHDPIQTRFGSASTDADSIHSNITADGRASNATDTPPTSQADSASVSSNSADAKLDDVAVSAALTDHPVSAVVQVNVDVDVDMDVVEAPIADSPTPISPSTPIVRARRVRLSAGSYNLKVLSGTACHVPRKYRKEDDDLPDTLNGPRRLSIADDDNTTTTTRLRGLVSKTTESLANEAGRAAGRGWGLRRTKSMGALSESPKTRKGGRAESLVSVDTRRSSTRLTGAKLETLTEKMSVLGKRGRKMFEAGIQKTKRELRNLVDTPEFAHIDTRPVVHEVWSNGKLVIEGAEPPKKRTRREDAKQKAEEDAAAAEAKVQAKQAKARKDKSWLQKGLYAGQDAQVNLISLYGPVERSSRYDSFLPKFKSNGLLPLPMWHGERLIHIGRDFLLPYDICSPPTRSEKPDEWRKTTRNRFIGDAAALWKKTTLFDDFSSRCVCGPKGGCDEDCQNRIMLYECDDQNCSAGRDHCSNRAFADLQDRRKAGGVYRIGVDVIKTADRGYGVRSNRCFKANQIIVEYTGEIITEEECDRRMNEDYKDNECYYLMSFDQNMIIDATRGSIARFVNHSCEPNCRMVKWIVAGQPRMALFAGDRDIMTGEELTYDYNFDPFSAKNVQKCLCGSSNCRGVLGPRPKDHNKPKPVADGLKKVVRKGKRKLKELVAEEKTTTKRRKIAKPVSPSAKGKGVKKGVMMRKKPGPKPKAGLKAKATTGRGKALTGRKMSSKKVTTVKTTIKGRGVKGLAPAKVGRGAKGVKTTKAKAKTDSAMVKMKSKSVKVLKTYGRGGSGKWKSVATSTTSVKRVRKATAKAAAASVIGSSPVKANGLKRVSADLAKSLRKQPK